MYAFACKQGITVFIFHSVHLAEIINQNENDTSSISIVQQQQQQQKQEKCVLHGPSTEANQRRRRRYHHLPVCLRVCVWCWKYHRHRHTQKEREREKRREERSRNVRSTSFKCSGPELLLHERSLDWNFPLDQPSHLALTTNDGGPDSLHRLRLTYWIAAVGVNCCNRTIGLYSPEPAVLVLRPLKLVWIFNGWLSCSNR